MQKNMLYAAASMTLQKKNESETAYYKKLLENGSVKLFELPPNLKGLINMQDVSDFNENRYFCMHESEKTGKDSGKTRLEYSHFFIF